MNIACMFTSISTLLLLLTFVWQHIAAVTYASGIDDLTPSVVQTDLRITVIVLLWVAFTIMALVALGLV